MCTATDEIVCHTADDFQWEHDWERLAEYHEIGVPYPITAVRRHVSRCEAGVHDPVRQAYCCGSWCPVSELLGQIYLGGMWMPLLPDHDPVDTAATVRRARLLP